MKEGAPGGVGIASIALFEEERSNASIDGSAI